MGFFGPAARVAVLLALVACTALAQADFAAAPGFSGRVADCSSCHRPPLQGDDATIALEHLPVSWDAGAETQMTVRIEGGPETIPTGPQAGFEVEVLAGMLRGDATDGVRSFHDRQATYTEDGVHQRQWRFTWTAPTLTTFPAPVMFWVAGIAANGNHNTELNTSDLGEHGDSVATLVANVPPSPATVQAWRDMPLRPPVIVSVDKTPSGHLLTGELPDANATELHIHDGQTWNVREVSGPWRLAVVGEGIITLRAAGAERQSPEIVLDLERATPVPQRQTPAVAGVLAVIAAALCRRPP